MIKDKAEVLDFLKKFMLACKNDIFLDPERLKPMLGIDVTEWVRTRATLLGIHSTPLQNEFNTEKIPQNPFKWVWRC